MRKVLEVKNIIQIKFTVALIFGLTSVAAVGETPIPVRQPTWYEHVDLMQILIGFLFIVTGWFLIYTLKKIDDNQSEIFRRLIKLEKSTAELWGEHHIAVKNHFKDKVEDTVN